MEFAPLVYNAARDGKLQRLRIVLDRRPRAEVQALVAAKTSGATPLIMACRNGHYDVVQYLLDDCYADIEQVGSVTFDGETIDGAPPLWCAAAAGHLKIVKYLIKMGGGCNKTTYTNSTPLRAACFDGHADIVQYLVEHQANIEIANRHGHTCLMISCYKGHYAIVKYLLEKDADVNRKSLKGNTALHDCAESGSLEIMKLLLSYKARMEKDSYGMTPLLAAAVTGHTEIVEFLIARPECVRTEKVDALELLGATYVDKKRDMLGALRFWKAAMVERYRSPPMEKPCAASSIDAYENSVEVRSMEQLEDLIRDPDDMRMQALLVRERILGPAHPDTSYYIRYRGAVYADMGNYDRCILLWMYALDMQQKMLEPLSPMTLSSLLSFAELFSFMMTESRHRPAYPVSFADMMVVYEKAVQELSVGHAQITRGCGGAGSATTNGDGSTSAPVAPEHDMTHFNRLLLIIMHLTCLLCRIQPAMTEEQQMAFRRHVYRFVRLDARGTKSVTPLHLACSKETTTVGRYPVCTFPSEDVAALLIETGANVNATDVDLNTPLHVAAANKPCRPEVVRTLLEHGAHIDSRNMDQRNPMQLIRNLTIYDIVSPLNYMSLQCIAARKVQESGIQYKGHIPAKLETFVSMH